MGSSSEKQDSYTVELIVAAGYIIFFCLALILYITFLVNITNNSQKHSTPVNVFATSLPATTPTPHISSLIQPVVIRLFEDDFTNDSNHWTLRKNIFKEEARDSKLYFESLIDGDYAFTACGRCPKLKDPFYLQAEFATTEATDKNFGIIFNLNYSDNSFYVFQINTEAQKYFFRHRSADGWSLRTAGESDQIKSFPVANALGLYVDQDTVEFYINGQIVDSYTESGYTFHKGDFAFYVDDSNFTLTVDNLTISKIGN